jgi:arsenite methyltransferase
MSEGNVSNPSTSLLIANATTCCGPAEVGEQAGGNLHDTLKDLMARYNVNDYAASVKVFAIKPRS